MATCSIMAGPREIVECLQINQDLLNTPSVGVPGNAFFGSNQLNLAPAERERSSELFIPLPLAFWISNVLCVSAMTLQSSLGSAGSAHIDPMDSPSHFTNMTCLSDLPPGWDPGRFFVLYPGVFYELGDLVSFCFSGLWRHGGTPPLAPPEASDDQLRWASRVTIVGYPPTGSVTANQRRVLCADGIGGHFSVSPEMIVPEYVTTSYPCMRVLIVTGNCRHIAQTGLRVNHSTFASEGLSVMHRSSLMKFMARSLLHVACFVTRQLPASLDVRIDSDAFLNSFTFVDESGDRQQVGSWALGPGWRSSSSSRGRDDDPSVCIDLISQKDRVEEQHRRWEEYHTKYAGHIPYAVAVKPGICALEGWDSEDIHSKLPASKLQKRERALLLLFCRSRSISYTVVPRREAHENFSKF